MDQLKILSGNAHPQLAHDICSSLKIKLADALVGRFSEGEVKG